MTPKDRQTADSPSSLLDETMAAYDQLLRVLSASRSPEFLDSAITMAQMKVLMLLSVTGEARMSEMAGQLGVSLSTVSGLVDRLVDAGLARRREDAADRRHVLVSPTPAGTALIDRFQELGSRQLRQLLSQLDPHALATVKQAIDLLVKAASQTEEPT